MHIEPKRILREEKVKLLWETMLNNDRAILDHQYLFIFPHRAKTDLSVPPASVGQSWPLQTEGLVARPFPGYLAALDWQPALYFLGHDCLGDSL